MTRDEAIKRFNDAADGSFSGEAWIDRFVALGILNLDEPKSVIDRLANGMTRAGFNPFTRSELKAILESEGLKLVEK